MPCLLAVLLRLLSLGLALAVIAASGFAFKFMASHHSTDLDKLLSVFFNLVGIGLGSLLALAQLVGPLCPSFFRLFGFLKFNAGQAACFFFIGSFTIPYANMVLKLGETALLLFILGGSCLVCGLLHLIAAFTLPQPRLSAYEPLTGKEEEEGEEDDDGDGDDGDDGDDDAEDGGNGDRTNGGDEIDEGGGGGRTTSTVAAEDRTEDGGGQQGGGAASSNRAATAADVKGGGGAGSKGGTTNAAETEKEVRFDGAAYQGMEKV